MANINQDSDEAALNQMITHAQSSSRQPKIQNPSPSYSNDDEALNALVQHVQPKAPVTPVAPVVHTNAPQLNAQDTPDYANMPWSEVASSGASNLGSSAKSKFSELGHAVMNPSETLSALGQIGTGLYSKAKGNFVDQDPAEKARAEAVVNALGQHYADTYGSMAGFKKTLATNPFDIGMDAASFVPFVGAGARAAGLTAEVAGAAGKVASLGSAAGKAVSMLDPIQASIAAGSKIAGGLGKAADWAVTGTQAGLSNVPKSLLNVAREAGATNDVENATAFWKFHTKQGNIADIPDTAMNAVDELKQNATQSYLSDRANLAKSQVQLPMDKVIDKLKDLNDFVSKQGRFSTMKNVVADINDQIVSTIKSSDPTSRTMLDLDNLKQSINQHIPNAPSVFKGKINEISKAIRDTVADHDPTYANMMENWGKWKDDLNEYQVELRLRPSGTTAQQLGKMLKESKANNDMPLISALASTQAGKTLPYMLSGHATSPWLAKGTLAQFEYPLAGLTAITNPTLWPHIVAGSLASSPRLGGATQYAAGKVGKYLAPVGRAADYATSVPVTYGATRLGEAEMQDHANGGRINRKSGGRANNEAKEIGMKLIELAERIKKEQGKGTEPLLNVDDTTIAKALKIANRSI